MTTIAPNTLAKRRSRQKPETRAAERAYRARNRTAEFARNAARRRTPDGWVLAALRGAKHRAKLRGLEFNLTADDVVLPTVCPALGIPIRFGSGFNTRRNPNSPSLDRRDNSAGYVRGNVAVVSIRANQLKSDASLDELRRLVAFLEAGSAP